MATKKKGEKKKQLTEEGKRESLKETFQNISKAFGEGSIMKLGERQVMNIKSISTGSLNLDSALGIGGLPKGRIIEIYGAESSGKTTLTLHLVAEAQKQGGIAAFIDAEHALDPVYAKALGVDIDELLISQPNSGEEALQIADMLISSGAIDLIVIDSVAALVPKAELEGEMHEQQMGLQARLMSKALRKLTSLASKFDCMLVFINQIREKIGGFGSFGGAPQTTTSGGRALKFFSSVRLEVKRVGTLKQGEDPVGSNVVVKVTKNKVAPPFKEAKFNIVYGKGISRANEILEKAIEYQLVKKAGSWLSFGEKRLGQGQFNVEEKMEQDSELFNEIYEAVKKAELEIGDPKNLKKKAKKAKEEIDESSEDEEIYQAIENDDTVEISLEDIEE